MNTQEKARFFLEGIDSVLEGVFTYTLIDDTQAILPLGDVVMAVPSEDTEECVLQEAFDDGDHLDRIEGMTFVCPYDVISEARDIIAELINEKGGQ